MKYRVTYGNGQCSETFPSYRAARDHIEMHDGQIHTLYVEYFRIQRYDGDEWIGLGKAGRPHLAE